MSADNKQTRRIPVTRKQAAVALLVLVVPAAIVFVLWRLTRDDTPTDLAGGAQPLKSEPAAIVPGIYLLGKMSPGAAYAVDTSDGIVLIDSGIDASAASVLKQLNELSLDPARLKAILLTHVHADHSQGAARLREQFGARIYAGKADCEPLRAGGPRDAFFSTFEMPKNTAHATTIDVELSGGEVIEIGDARIQVIAAPGHTPGSVCYLLERRSLRAIFTGDVIQSLSPATRDVLGTYAAYLPPRYRGNASDYLATLRRLRDLPTPHLVLPGHPGMDAEPQNPQLGTERWHGLLDRGIAEMAKLSARLKTDGEDFLDGSPKELLPGLHYCGDLNESAVYALTLPDGVVLFDAPGQGLSALLAKRLGPKQKVIAVVLTSVGPTATAGLAELVREHACLIVAPKAGVDGVRKLCPVGTKVLTEDDQFHAGQFELRTVPLAGRGMAPTAYMLRWTAKTVVISGRIPQKLNSQAMIDLMREVRQVDDGPNKFRRSLDELLKITPDLWLPAVPVYGQNANVYDREWADMLERNAEVFP